MYKAKDCHLLGAVKHQLLLCYVVIVISTPLASSADELRSTTIFQQAKSALENKRYAAAADGFTQLAEHAHPSAMFYLARMYEQGWGMPLNQQQAFYCYQQAAQRGHSAARLQLGHAYKYGRGTVPSEEQAVFWWQKAAAQGEAEAQFHLALHYYAGLGVEKNMARATTLLKQSAAGGYQRAALLMASKQMKPGRVIEEKKQHDARVTAVNQTAVEQRLTVGPYEVPVYPLATLTKQMSARYTIQLAVMTKRSYLLALLAKDVLAQEAMVATHRRTEGLFYYVLIGDFSSRSQAQQRLAQLTPELRRLNPWVRPWVEVGR